MPPKVEAARKVVFVDGIHLGRKAVVLIASDDEHALGWHLCRSENGRAWAALMSRVAAPEVVVSDGGDGFAKALRQTWPSTRHQRCVFHAFCQVRRYTTTRPRTPAGVELYALAKALLSITTLREADGWAQARVMLQKVCLPRRRPRSQGAENHPPELARPDFPVFQKVCPGIP